LPISFSEVNLFFKKGFDFLNFKLLSRQRYFAVERQCHFKGTHVPQLYAEKRFAETEEHAAEDLVLCEKLVEELSGSRGRPPSAMKNPGRTLSF
jgi:hypothetical protein